MYQNKSDYDRGVNTFSPEGRLFQVEYAIKAIELGSLAVGITSTDGVILAVEKRLTSRLLEKDSVEKLFEIDTGAGVACSGLIADARTLVDIARVEAQNHRFTYDESITPESLMKSLSDTMISFGEGEDDRKDAQHNAPRMSRPFGVALLMAGLQHGDHGQPVLWSIDPSGTYVEFKAHAIGNGGEGAKSMLAERWSSELNLHDALVLAARVVSETMEDTASAENVDFARISADGGYALIGADEVTAALEAAAAQKAEEGD